MSKFDTLIDLALDVAESDEYKLFVNYMLENITDPEISQSDCVQALEEVVRNAPSEVLKDFSDVISDCNDDDREKLMHLYIANCILGQLLYGQEVFKSMEGEL